MKQFVYAVFDRASGVYDRPFVGQGDGAVMRSFGDIAVSADHPIGQHPEDYTLFRIGTYDDNSGELLGCPAEKVVGAVEMVAESRKTVKEVPVDLLKAAGEVN